MMQKPLRPCNKPGCNALTRDTYCDRHKQEPDKQRKSAQERGYTYQWHKESRDYLREHPWCVECQKRGIGEPATEVDHIIPHRGDQGLFWDKDNWQGLCKTCHSIKTAKEDGGFGNTRRG